MKRNVIKALVLLFVLLAIFAVSGCEREQGGEGYTKEVMYRSLSVDKDVLKSKSVLTVEETDKIGLAVYRGVAHYRGNGTMMRLELKEYYHNVVTPRSLTCDFDEQGRLIVYTRNYGDVEKDIFQYVYDDSGNLISTTSTDESGVAWLRDEFTYEYDKKGNVTRIDNIHYYDEGKENLRKYTTYEYDRRGNLISCKVSSGNNYSYEYDKKGNLIVVTEYRSNGDKYVTEYLPGSDQMIKKTKYENMLNRQTVMTQVTEYSEDGYDETIWEYSRYDGALRGLAKRKYDEDGNLIDHTVLSIGGGYRYSYLYDHSGYLMSKTEYSGNGKRAQAEYYDVYRRIVRVETYDRHDKVEEAIKYIYGEPEYEANDMGGDGIRSSHIRTEYFDADGALIKYTENGKTYDARGNEME